MILEGKAAIVTGGAVRLGRAISLALADAGAAVCVHFGHSVREAEDVAQRIASHGGRATAVRADLQAPCAAAEMIVSHALEHLGRIDILVNSAAIFEPGTLESTTERQWDRHFSINLKAPFFLCQTFARQLGPGQEAQIVNIVDWRALRPKPDHLAYTLTKSGLVTMTRILAQELAPAVRVNAIAPGAILPPPDMDQAAFNELADRIPLRRTGNPRDVVEALLYLLHSEFLTGEVLHVTGGEQL